jgi:hypothetical protein
MKARWKSVAGGFLALLLVTGLVVATPRFFTRKGDATRRALVEEIAAADRYIASCDVLNRQLHPQFAKKVDNISELALKLVRENPNAMVRELKEAVDLVARADVIWDLGGEIEIDRQIEKDHPLTGGPNDWDNDNSNGKILQAALKHQIKCHDQITKEMDEAAAVYGLSMFPFFKRGDAVSTAKALVSLAVGRVGR